MQVYIMVTYKAKPTFLHSSPVGNAERRMNVICTSFESPLILHTTM